MRAILYRQHNIAIYFTALKTRMEALSQFILVLPLEEESRKPNTNSDGGAQDIWNELKKELGFPT